MRQPDKILVIQLLKWSVFSLIIPALGIFIRWLVSFAQAGPEFVALADMLRESEVAFLAATMLAETLGDAPDVGKEDPDLNRLIAARALLSAFLVLSLLIFGALVPLAGSTTWLSDRGQGFHASLNTTILMIAILTCLIARCIYWRCETRHLPTEHKPSDLDLQAEHSQRELKEEHD